MVIGVSKENAPALATWNGFCFDFITVVLRCHEATTAWHVHTRLIVTPVAVPDEGEGQI